MGASGSGFGCGPLLELPFLWVSNGRLDMLFPDQIRDQVPDFTPSFGIFVDLAASDACHLFCQ